MINRRNGAITHVFNLIANYRNKSQFLCGYITSRHQHKWKKSEKNGGSQWVFNFHVDSNHVLLTSID